MINARNTLGLAGYRESRKAIFAVVLAVAALVVLASQARAQESGTFDLYGTVVDAGSGQALEGAWVGLSGTDWGSITNNEGRFRIPDLVAGRLALKIERIGYETLEWTGTVDADNEQLRIGLSAQPLVLEGLTVVTNSFRARRNAVATTVHAYDAGDLANGSRRTALEFIRDRTGASVVGCNGQRGSSCLYIRGRPIEPVVYIDELPVLGGLDRLDGFAPWEFHMIEVYAGGRHIRAYTPGFMQRAAEGRLLPIALPF